MTVPRALIYVVDDDELVLTSLASLLALETPHEVRCFASGEAALAALGDAPPALLISDLTMPGMNGLELLRAARQIAPDGARIALTGYADKQTAVRAINEAAIFQFVEKPWDNTQLLAVVASALTQVRLAAELKQTVAALQAKNAALEAEMRERKDAEERLIASERMAAVGRLASGIAHEIGNQLSLLGYAELLAERYAKDPEARELTDPLLAARRRLSSMISSIREYVRGSTALPYERDVQAVAPVVDEALSILRFEPALKLRRLVREPWDESAKAALNREKLLQVVINLLRNAFQATREHGTIHLSVERRNAEVALVVADDGVGIEPDKQDRIWEPFYSTKGDTGTGLGLGICKRIVTEHEGTIELKSAQGQGSVFTVLLPAR